jgi:galactokinase
MVGAAAWWAPGRVNLIGEHTDYNDGLALPVATQMGCRSSFSPAADGRLEIASAQFGRTVTVAVEDLRPGLAWAAADRWAAYAAGVIWAASRSVGGAGRIGGRVDIDSELPIGAGLSSSAAVCCSVAGTVLEAIGGKASPAAVAALATAAESEFVGAPTGRLDQLAVTCGRSGRALLIDFRDDSVRAVPFAPGSAGLALVVVDTGAPHANAGGGYAQRRAECRQACEQLGLTSLRQAGLGDLDRIASPVLRRRARHVIGENDRVRSAAHLLRAGQVAELGPLLTASQTSMRDDFEITAPRVDVAVEALMAAGAKGARMTGGGFGGCVIGLVPSDVAAEAIAAVRRRLDDDALWAATIVASDAAHRA